MHIITNTDTRQQLLEYITCCNAGAMQSEGIKLTRE
jgi:hypothetical protein